MKFQILALLSLAVQDSSCTLYFLGNFGQKTGGLGGLFGGSSSGGSSGLISGITGIVNGITGILGGGGSSSSSSNQVATQKVSTTTTTTIENDQDNSSDSEVNYYPGKRKYNLNRFISSIDFKRPKNRRRRRRSKNMRRRRYRPGYDSFNQAVGKDVNIYYVPQTTQYNVNNVYKNYNIQNNDLQDQNISQVVINGETVPTTYFIQLLRESDVFSNQNQSQIRTILNALNGRRNVLFNGVNDGQIQFDGNRYYPGQLVDLSTGDSQDQGDQQQEQYQNVQWSDQDQQEDQE